MNMHKISLAHGSGGIETASLLQSVIFDNVPGWLKKVGTGLGIDFPDDSAAIPVPGGYMTVSIDAYTVNPIFFPGGDLGKLAAAGTINDILMGGGKPIAALDAIVVQEGVEVEVLKEVVDSMIGVFKEEGVALIGGDLKVMPSKHLDGIVVTTAGLGFAEKPISDKNITPGDKIIVTGPVGEHGAAILASQQNTPSHEFKSDVAPLTKLMIPIINEFVDHIHAARDPTRGGVAMCLNDWAKNSATTIVCNESDIPIREPVSNLCEMMGIDPLNLASEGVAMLAVAPDVAEQVLELIHRHGYRDARIIGEARKSTSTLDLVVLKTLIGGYRILEPPSGELVPRIC
jgi:hydrogenase expression/formation protein HypE